MLKTLWIRRLTDRCSGLARGSGPVIVLAISSTMCGQSQGNKPWDLWQLFSAVLMPMTTPCVSWHRIASAEFASVTCLQCTGLNFQPVQKVEAKYLCPHSKEFCYYLLDTSPSSQSCQ